MLLQYRSSLCNHLAYKTDPKSFRQLLTSHITCDYVRKQSRLIYVLQMAHLPMLHQQATVVLLDRLKQPAGMVLIVCRDTFLRRGDHQGAGLDGLQLARRKQNVKHVVRYPIRSLAPAEPLPLHRRLSHKPTTSLHQIDHRRKKRRRRVGLKDVKARHNQVANAVRVLRCQRSSNVCIDANGHHVCALPVASASISAASRRAASSILKGRMSTDWPWLGRSGTGR